MLMNSICAAVAVPPDKKSPKRGLRGGAVEADQRSNETDRSRGSNRSLARYRQRGLMSNRRYVGLLLQRSGNFQKLLLKRAEPLGGLKQRGSRDNMRRSKRLAPSVPSPVDGRVGEPSSRFPRLIIEIGPSARAERLLKKPAQ
jgi:hypothetical protein